MEVKTPGERIRRLRTQLGLRQEDLANDEVSKALISMIEKNKRNLTYPVAVVIANKLNTYFEMIGRKITPEELMETEAEKAKRELQEDIAHFQELLESDDIDIKIATPYFEKLMATAKKWNLNHEMMSLILLRGRLNYLTFQYEEALKDYSDILPYYIQTEDYYQIARVYNLMGCCNHKLFRMDQALNYYQKSYNLINENNFENDKVMLQSLYNLILCNKKLLKYDRAIYYINSFKELQEIDSTNPAFFKYLSKEIILVEANIYRDLRNYDKAKKTYDKLLALKDELDDSILFLAYENYSLMYEQQGKIDKALVYIEQALQLKDNIEKVYLPVALIVQTRYYLMLNDVERAIMSLKDGLDLSTRFADREKIIDFQSKLLEIYIEQNDFERACAHLQNIEGFMRNQG
ncbi:helix-turn-helix domain-containing protein [Alkaliphilus transvaalensis]|uniref:helix-turn-helix domain-containing protein n=1 Tax=Alkaliphilus transvaalensis TaxID=114628 RepID=UPI00047AD29A|nr:helix-turn-helix transcriptional regulator [Alkaliphilus transvaalensis]